MKTHPLLAALALTASLLLAGSAGAATLPVINPVSIEINGQAYHVGDTVTVTSPTVSYKMTLTYNNSDQVVLTAGDAGNPTIKEYAYLCIVSKAPETCLDIASTRPTYAVSHDGVFNVFDDNARTATNSARTLSLLPGANVLQVIHSTATNQFLGISGHVEKAVATGGTITLNYVVPPAMSLSANGNALAGTGKLAAVTGQSLTASVTAGSADQAGSGQVYVAANLPANFGAAAGLYFMDSAKRWAKWDGSGQFPAYKTGTALASAVSVDMGSIDLTGLSGTTVYVGYGVGTGAAADTDVLTGKYSSWMVQ